MGSSRPRNSTRAARARHTSNPQSKAKTELPPELSAQTIGRERRRLQKASAILACLIYSANHDAPGIDPGDIASVAQELIDRAVLALDAVELRKR